VETDALTEENRNAVLWALLHLALDPDAPAGARVAAARLFLAQFGETNAERDVLVVVDEAAFVETV